MDTAVGTIPIFLLYRTRTAYSLTPPRLVRPYIFSFTSDETLEVLEAVSGSLGSQLRIFAHDTCPSFSTRELCRKAESCSRHQVWEGMNGMT